MGLKQNPEEPHANYFPVRYKIRWTDKLQYNSLFSIMQVRF